MAVRGTGNGLSVFGWCVVLGVGGAVELGSDLGGMCRAFVDVKRGGVLGYSEVVWG